MRLKVIHAIILRISALLILMALNFNAHSFQARVFSYNSSKNVSLKLKGEWQFSYGETLEAAESAEFKPITVPGSWDNYGYPMFGYGIYQTNILQEDKEQLGILFPFLVVDYQIIANDSLLFESRDFSISTNDSPLPGRIRAFFQLPVSDTIQLKVIVKNTETRTPGINLSPIVSSYEKLVYKEENRQVFEYTGIGMLFIISIYHFVLYGFLRLRSNLWLAIIAMIISIRGTVVYDSSFLLYHVFPNLDFFIAKKLEYGFLYLSPGLAPMMFRDQFGIKKYDLVIKILSVLSIGMALMVVVLPVASFEATVDVFHVIIIFSLIISLDIIRIAVMNKLQTSKIVLTGLIITSTLIVLEILKNTNVLYIDLGSNILNSAMVIYIFIQAVALSAQMAQIYRENKYLNVHLEQSVEKKTIALSEANNLKGRVLSVVTHDLINPLSNLKGTLDLLNANVLTAKDFEKMKEGITEQITSNINLMEDVLNWSSLEIKKDAKTGAQSNCLIAETVETVLKQMRQPAFDKRIKISSEIGKDSLVIADPDAVIIILRNLISNAIKFSNPHGKIMLVEHVGDTYIKFGVVDNGIGIPDDLKSSIFSSSATRYGTQKEKGRGVGLLIVKDLVNQHGGKIWIEDNPNETGTAFYFTLKKTSQ